MSDGAALAVLLAASLGTYLARSVMIFLLADRTLPLPVERALGHVGPAVLAALTINLAIGADGIGSTELAEVAALIVAVVVALWRKDLVWTFLAGMSTLWLAGALT